MLLSSYDIDEGEGSSRDLDNVEDLLGLAE